jgi:hypothetical protein
MSERNVQIARQAYEAWGRDGIDGILEYLDPEIEWRTWERFARGPRVYKGHEGVRQLLQSIFLDNFDDFAVEPREFIDAGEAVVVPVRLRGKAKGTGEEESFDLVQVWTERDGKALRLDVYDSKEEALSALGRGSA